MLCGEGDLFKGSGSFDFDLASSEAARDLPVTWASRTERPDGKTSPEELIAAQNAAEQGEQGCPISNALRGNVDIQLNASLA